VGCAHRFPLATGAAGCGCRGRCGSWCELHGPFGRRGPQTRAAALSATQVGRLEADSAGAADGNNGVACRSPTRGRHTAGGLPARSVIWQPRREAPRRRPQAGRAAAERARRGPWPRRRPSPRPGRGADPERSAGARPHAAAASAAAGLAAAQVGERAAQLPALVRAPGAPWWARPWRALLRWWHRGAAAELARLSLGAAEARAAAEAAAATAAAQAEAAGPPAAEAARCEAALAASRAAHAEAAAARDAAAARVAARAADRTALIARLEAAELAWRAAFADRVAALTDVAREAPRIARLRLWTPGRHLPRDLVLIDTPGLNAAAPAAAARAWAAVRALADAVLVVSDVRQAVPASLLAAVARMGVPHAALALTRADLVWRDSDAPELELAEAARAAAGRFAAALGQAPEQVLVMSLAPARVLKPGPGDRLFVERFDLELGALVRRLQAEAPLAAAARASQDLRLALRRCAEACAAATRRARADAAALSALGPPPDAGQRAAWVVAEAPRLAAAAEAGRAAAAAALDPALRRALDPLRASLAAADPAGLAAARAALPAEVQAALDRALTEALSAGEAPCRAALDAAAAQVRAALRAAWSAALPPASLGPTEALPQSTAPISAIDPALALRLRGALLAPAPPRARQRAPGRRSRSPQATEPRSGEPQGARDRRASAGGAPARLASALFPGGLSAHISVTHTEQYGKNQKLLAALRGGAWDEELALTSSTVLVDRVDAAIRAFQTAWETDVVRRASASVVTFDEVREAELRCHEGMVTFFVDALSLLQSEPELLGQVLAPFGRHQADQRAARRLGARPEDADGLDGSAEAPLGAEDVAAGG
jgi:hypothetical protein